MLVRPPRPAAPLTLDPPPLDTGARVEAVLRLVNGSTPARRSALTALLRILAQPRQRLGPLAYVEISQGYVGKAAEVSRETARQAWHELQPIVGWVSVHVDRALALGFTLRERRPGSYWGQHLILPAWSLETAQQGAQRLGLGRAESAPLDERAWARVRLTARGRRNFARCPWHEDGDPSLRLFDNVDETGGCYCHGCGARGYWRRVDGVVMVRRAREDSKGSDTPTPRGSCTIQDSTSTTTANDSEDDSDTTTTQTQGSVVIATLGDLALRRRRSACSDLLEALRASERISSTDKAWGHAISSHLDWSRSDKEDPRGFVPDRLIAVDPMRPTAWAERTFRGRTVRVPDTWAAVAVGWVVVDLDAFDTAPIADTSLHSAGERIARWALAHPDLSGRVAVVRTSHLGVQVFCELLEARSAPRRWFNTAKARRLCACLDTLALHEVREAGFTGGHADQAVHAAGRMARRPGWRVSKDGSLFRSRLVCSFDRP